MSAEDPRGGGKYDAECTVARASAGHPNGRTSVLLIVLGGRLGNGFEVQAEPEVLAALPAILHELADSVAQTHAEALARDRAEAS
jgi:hypothetical protein